MKNIRTGEYPSFSTGIDMDRFRKFLLVLGEDAEEFISREQGAIPPGFLFHIALENRFDIRNYIDPLRTVATRHVQTFYQGIPLKATLKVSPSITSVKEYSRWTEIEVVVRFYLDSGKLACEQTTVFMEKKKVTQ